jgi:four helix bundle protein
MSNMADGFDCDSEIEFGRFLGFARRSAVEVQSHLYTVLDANYIIQEEIDIHDEQVRKARALIGGIRHS